MGGGTGRGDYSCYLMFPSVTLSPPSVIVARPEDSIVVRWVGSNISLRHGTCPTCARSWVHDH